MNIHLNPDLDIDKISQNYSSELRVRINHLLPVDQAQALSQCLAEQVNYKHAFVLDNNYGEVSDEQLDNLPEKDRDQLLNGILAQAAQGVGFWYERHAIKAEAPGLAGDLFQWLNSEALLNVIAQITGETAYSSSMIQATRYQPGDFLTRHKDDITEQKRQTAFVINLSPSWHPDCGGLLQFYEMDGTPRDTWSPDFNSLSLFDVSHVHSVTCVSPFAPEPRLAFSGWFQL